MPSTLKLKMKIDSDKRIETIFQIHMKKELFMNSASKLGPHTQTDRGTCPGVGL
jgi:hypothetical protein